MRPEKIIPLPKQASSPVAKPKETSGTALIRHLRTKKDGESQKGEIDQKAFDIVQALMIEGGVFPDKRDRPPYSAKVILKKRRFEQIALMLLTVVDRVHPQDNSTLPNQVTPMEKRRKALQDARNVIAGEIEKRKGYIFRFNKYQETAEEILGFLDFMILDFPRKKRIHKRDQHVEECLGHLVEMFIGEGCTQEKATDILSGILNQFGSPLSEYTPKMLEKAHYKTQSKTSPKSPQ